MTETTTMVHVRVNGKIKAQATRALTAMGLSVSDAVRVLLTRIAADKQFPFELKVPNAETRAAMHEARTMSKAQFPNADEMIRELDESARR
jgi:DNA-damage-inducible protein J